MSDSSADPSTRKTRGKKKNYALLEDEDEELFQKLLEEIDEEESSHGHENGEENDPNFSPLVINDGHVPKRKRGRGRRGRGKPRLTFQQRKWKSQIKEESHHSYDSTNDMENTYEDFNASNEPDNDNINGSERVQKKRGRKRKLEEWTYKSSLNNKSVNDIVVKEKLLADMNLGIDRNLPVEEIIGASIELGFPAYMVTWKGSDEADLLPAEICKRKYPQPLLSFFEKHLTFPC